MSKKTIQRIGMLFLALTVLLTTTTFAFSDVGADHWANSDINKLASLNIIKGDENGSFNPSSKVTRAELSAMITRLFNTKNKADVSTFADLTKDSWQAEEMAKGVELGIIKGDSPTIIRPDGFVTRQEIAVMLQRVLRVNKTKSVKQFTEGNTVDEWAVESFEAMLGGGLIGGYPDNTIKPTGNITRAETAAVLSRIFDSTITEPGNYNKDINGDVILNNVGVKLDNLTISGNLYITDGVDKSSLELSNVKVLGKIVVVSAGKDTISFDNSSVNDLEVLKSDVNLSFKNNSTTKSLIVNAPCAINGGGIEKLTLSKEMPKNSTIKLADKIPNITVNSNHITIESTNANIDQLTLTGENIKVTGTGTIGTAKIENSGSELVIKPEKTIVESGVQVTVAGQNVVGQTGGTTIDGQPAPTTQPTTAPTTAPTAEPTAAPTNPPPSGGDSGGGGGGSGQTKAILTYEDGTNLDAWSMKRYDKNRTDSTLVEVSYKAADRKEAIEKLIDVIAKNSDNTFASLISKGIKTYSESNMSSLLNDYINQSTPEQVQNLFEDLIDSISDTEIITLYDSLITNNPILDALVGGDQGNAPAIRAKFKPLATKEIAPLVFNEIVTDTKLNLTTLVINSFNATEKAELAEILKTINNNADSISNFNTVLSRILGYLTMKDIRAAIDDGIIL